MAGAPHPGLIRPGIAPSTVWVVTQIPEYGMPPDPHEDPVTVVHRAAAEALAGGPMALSVLAHRLRVGGALATFDDDVDDEYDGDT